MDAPGTISPLDRVVKDPQTVELDGARVMSPIDGVKLRVAVTRADEYRTVCEIYDERWGFHRLPPDSDLIPYRA